MNKGIFHIADFLISNGKKLMNFYQLSFKGDAWANFKARVSTSDCFVVLGKFDV